MATGRRIIHRSCRAANSSVWPLPARWQPRPKSSLPMSPPGNLDGSTGTSIIDLLFERRAALGRNAADHHPRPRPRTQMRPRDRNARWPCGGERGLSLSLAAIWRISRRDLSARDSRAAATCHLPVPGRGDVGGDRQPHSWHSRRTLTSRANDFRRRYRNRHCPARSDRGRNGRDAQGRVGFRNRPPAGDGYWRRQPARRTESHRRCLPALWGANFADGGTVKAPAKGEIYVGPTLSERLDIETGGTVRFGEATFKVAGIIEEEPDRLGEGFTLGPVAIINMASLPDTGLIQPGSMYEAKYRIKLGPKRTRRPLPKHSKHNSLRQAGTSLTARTARRGRGGLSNGWGNS